MTTVEPLDGMRAVLEQRIPFVRALPGMHRLDAAGLLALYSSFSGLASLSPAGREAALEDIRAVLDRHGVHEAALTFRTQVTTVRAG